MFFFYKTYVFQQNTSYYFAFICLFKSSLGTAMIIETRVFTVFYSFNYPSVILETLLYNLQNIFIWMLQSDKKIITQVDIPYRAKKKLHCVKFTTMGSFPDLIIWILSVYCAQHNATNELLDSLMVERPQCGRSRVRSPATWKMVPVAPLLGAQH